jgi:hypothetical protein
MNILHSQISQTVSTIETFQLTFYEFPILTWGPHILADTIIALYPADPVFHHALRPAIPTEILRGFPQRLQLSTGMESQIRP